MESKHGGWERGGEEGEGGGWEGGRTGARRGGEGEKSKRAEKVVLVSIRRKQSEISRQEFDIAGICIRSPMRDLTSTDSAHHSERGARGAIPYWSLVRIHVFMNLTLMQLRGLQGCELREKVPRTGKAVEAWASSSRDGRGEHNWRIRR